MQKMYKEADNEEKLVKLYNTMNMIETKGRNTKIMAECLGYLERLIKDEQKKEEQQKETKEITEE
jgi:hypothetical protein